MKSILGLGLSAFLISSAQAATYTDVVLVDAPQPFYIDIFETTADEAMASASGITYSRSGYPARMNVNQAKQVCQRKGMRLPTKNEWITAASNVGRNRNYSLVGDTIRGPSGSIQANIHVGDSLPVHQDAVVGLDAVGTVGMTGNRAEYYLDPDGSVGLCGGEYETRSETAVVLSSICSFQDNQKSTVRCVVDHDPSISVQLSSRVSQRVKSHIAPKTPGATTGAAAPAPGQAPAAPAPAPTPTPTTPQYDDEY